jgi:hypothetical protein
MDKDSFVKEMLKEFNFVREDPQRYAEKLRSYMSYIKYNHKTNQTVFSIPKTIKINLSNGKEAFNSCINSLKGGRGVPSLEFRDDLSFPFPYEQLDQCTSKDYLTSTFLEMNMRLKDKYSILGFHYDINVNDPEVSTLLQIVDDNNSNGQRRKQILDKDVRYVGINLGFLRDNIVCIYVVFAS